MKHEIPYPNIRNLREENDLTQADVAKILNCTQAAYCHYEIGNRDFPTRFLITLSDYYGCSIDYLLGHEVPKKTVERKPSKNKHRGN